MDFTSYVNTTGEVFCFVFGTQSRPIKGRLHVAITQVSELGYSTEPVTTLYFRRSTMEAVAVSNSKLRFPSLVLVCYRYIFPRLLTYPTNSQ